MSESGRISRRALLGGAGGLAVVVAGGALVENEVLPGRTRAYRLLGLNGDEAPIPDVAAGEVVSGSFVSEAMRGQPVGWSVAYPPDTPTDALLPVLVALHHASGDHSTVFGPLAMDRFLALAVADGVPPFAIASVDGAYGYWHQRADGTDAGAVVTDELLPLLAERGLDVDRIGYLGWSMGGYGALLLGATTPGDRVKVVAASSPALSTDFADTVSGPFDDADDFAANDVFELREELSRVPLWVDCGRGDPFFHAVDEFVDGFDPAPAGGFEAGAHNVGYWRRRAPEQLAFIGPLLAAG